MFILASLIVLFSFGSVCVSIWLAFKYIKYHLKDNSSGHTGTSIARKILDDNGLHHIEIKSTGSRMFGNSYSHYFKKVRLRRLTRHETSLTSLGMGAQKACLAILAKENDPDMVKLIKLVPLITFGPFAFIPLVAIGVMLDIILFSGSGIFTLILGALGFLFYVYSIVLSLVTLKTEKKAQERAYEILRGYNVITDHEPECLKELFRLYNIQYVNDIILASLELVYVILKILVKIKRND